MHHCNPLWFVLHFPIRKNCREARTSISLGNGQFPIIPVPVFSYMPCLVEMLSFFWTTGILRPPPPPPALFLIREAMMREGLSGYRPLYFGSFKNQGSTYYFSSRYLHEEMPLLYRSPEALTLPCWHVHSLQIVVSLTHDIFFCTCIWRFWILFYGSCSVFF